MYETLYKWRDEPHLRLGSVVAQYGRKMLLLFSELTLRQTIPGNRKFLFWRPVPKFHLFQHCLEDQVCTAGNPIEFWNYTDESKIGDLADIAEKCNPHYLHRSVLLRERIDETKTD